MNVSDGLRSRLPIVSWAPRYRRRWFGGDLLAGLVVAALAVPQALGYAGIAGVPVVVGIYAIPAALIAYAIFGSSPHLVVGRSPPCRSYPARLWRQWRPATPPAPRPSPPRWP